MSPPSPRPARAGRREDADADADAVRRRSAFRREYVDDDRFGRGSWFDRAGLVGSLVGVALLVTMLVPGRDAVAAPVWWFLVALGGTSVVDLVLRLGMALVRRRRTALRAGLSTPPG